MTARRKTRQIVLRHPTNPVAVGGDAPVSVQSMTTTKTSDVEGTLQQIYALYGAGADIVRCTCNEPEAAEVHYNYGLALQEQHEVREVGRANLLHWLHG